MRVGDAVAVVVGIGAAVLVLEAVVVLGLVGALVVDVGDAVVVAVAEVGVEGGHQEEPDVRRADAVADPPPEAAGQRPHPVQGPAPRQIDLERVDVAVKLDELVQAAAAGDLEDEVALAIDGVVGGGAVEQLGPELGGEGVGGLADQDPEVAGGAHRAEVDRPDRLHPPGHGLVAEVGAVGRRQRQPRQEAHVVLVVAAQRGEVGFPFQPEVADAGLAQVQAGGRPHGVDLVAVEEEGEGDADAGLEAAEEADGGGDLAGELVVDQVGLGRRARAVGEDGVGALLVVELEAEAESLVLGDVGPVDGQVVLRADGRLEQLGVDGAIERRRARLGARGHRREQDQAEGGAAEGEGRAGQARPKLSVHSQVVPPSSISLNALQSPRTLSSTLMANGEPPRACTRSMTWTTSPWGTTRSAAMMACRSGFLRQLAADEALDRLVVVGRSPFK